MRFCNSIFASLLKPLERRGFKALVARHRGDAYDKSFRSWDHLRQAWKTLTGYERFEVLVALALRGVIGAIIVVALFRLIAGTLDAVVLRALNPLDHVVFQQIFGAIMTLLIALEFNHTLRYVVTRHQSIIQTRVVVLIALLALARKLIVLDIHETTPGYLLGLAAITLALGVTYWLMRERDGAAGDSRRGQE